MMYFKLKSLIGALIVASTAALPLAAKAQPLSSSTPSPNESTADTIERAYFKNDPTFFRDQSIPRQFNKIFGVGTVIKNSYPENEQRRDTELADTIYKDALRQQSGGKTMRTRDLPNPYNSSILQSIYFNNRNRF